MCRFFVFVAVNRGESFKVSIVKFRMQLEKTNSSSKGSWKGSCCHVNRSTWRGPKMAPLPIADRGADGSETEAGPGSGPTKTFFLASRLDRESGWSCSALLSLSSQFLFQLYPTSESLILVILGSNRFTRSHKSFSSVAISLELVLPCSTHQSPPHI